MFCALVVILLGICYTYLSILPIDVQIMIGINDHLQHFCEKNASQKIIIKM